MSNEKAAIRNWTRTQSRLGRQAARSVVGAGLLSSLVGIGQVWCVAVVLGHALVNWKMADAAGPMPVWPFLAFPVLAILRALVMVQADTAAARAGIAARRRLRGEVLASVLTGGPALLRRVHSGVLASTIVDRVEALDGFFGRWIPASILWIIAPVAILIPIAIVQPHAALVLGLCGIAVPFGQALFGIGAAVASRNQFLAMTRLQARFLDRVKGIATIVLAGRAEDETRKLGDAAEELRQRTMKVLRVAFLSSASIDCAMVVALIAIAIMDGRQALALQAEGSAPALVHAVTAGLFVLLAVPEFFAPLRGLALAYQDRAHAQGAATAVLELPEAQERPAPEGARTVNANGVMVSFDDVSFSWDPARGLALDHVSFTVPAGETLILAGASGSGKSTIMELLLGFIQPDTGRVLFNGAPLDSIVPDALARMVSWIGQKPVLFAGTLRENILFAKPDASDAELQAALKSAAVDQFLPNLPEGLETRIGEGGFGLSGGQAQRIAIARAYLKNAPVLLLDEPTAHLDPATEKSVFESLQRLAVGRTVILATHSAAVHMFKGRRIDLASGRVISRQGAA
ncbi:MULTISPECIES: thiol reductant ABC exporter subunit CydD [Acetobacter]|uniref:Thiol reductant ABC exporter subunit CydD n=2 Tax=Acetobacter TaxID=434 RepID=A0AAN1PHR2_9PROT|nr:MULTISPECIES: thiol reductant ABC exporter subunit CydD [Acetobacter]ASL40175.1 thiol reductant ABC exporter subunit CydD [Acetobacter oryzifermentans]AXN00391.1 thiol reductant ABC exporter subunit CydD [Acetobacter pomorum]KAA8399294.1 thiol reductant ABC exporter subunit CydD [Acetobacter sp. DmW_125127]KAA8400030.1 thiol reductant ABC exporter subunit CydD [Acetobacter sp. DmW_125128]KAA8400809.1 thiol reductant ABC exporter subunit CydD [Acetobacter sp. DmW_125124]